MGLNYRNLDTVTREHMLHELERDISSERVYYSRRFNHTGINSWVPLLRDAILRHNDDWLASQLQNSGCIKEYEESSRQGKIIRKKVPYDAAMTYAEGEFNRFYARGVCLRALEENIPQVIVYRGKIVSNPRSESESKIGQRFPVKNLLEDLRSSQGVEPALGIPTGPNSGITIKIPE